MISELVDGSAWMKPPVDGPADGADRRGGLRRWRRRPCRRRCAAAVRRAGRRRRATAPPPPRTRLKAARSTAASLVASAFFRYTTQMLPEARRALQSAGPAARPASGCWPARRVGGAHEQRVAARIGHHRAAPAPPPAGTPGTAPPPESARRCTIGARSAATACCSGITSTSPAAGVSIAAMILPMRCRLSA